MTRAHSRRTSFMRQLAATALFALAAIASTGFAQDAPRRDAASTSPDATPAAPASTAVPGAVPASAAAAPGPAATPTSAPSTPADAAQALASFDWLAGCWQGNVVGRDFREDWMPRRGSMMVGISQTVQKDRTLSFEYLRLEPRDDGLWYATVASGKTETAFRYTGETMAQERRRFNFERPGAQDFPQRLAYEHGDEGSMLFASVEGTIEGKPRNVVYPMRRIDCATGQAPDK